MTQQTITQEGAFNTTQRNQINSNFNDQYQGLPPVTVGAASTETGVHLTTYLLGTAAGSTLTLGKATGSGRIITVVVTTTTTSGAHKVLAAANDYIGGAAIGENSGTAKIFKSDFATNHSLQMPYTGSQPSGGFVGDVIELIDIATHKWEANMVYQAGTTPTTPFSTSTT